MFRERLEGFDLAHVPGRVKRNARRAAARVGSVMPVSAVVALECQRSAWDGEVGRCRWCGGELEGRRTVWCSDECHYVFEINHFWQTSKEVALDAAGWMCTEPGCGETDDLQVNHIDPVVGRGYQPSCWHHQDNTEPLCRPHHQIRTNAQRELRVRTWTDEPRFRTITIPSATLPEDIRDDLLRRQLDRRSGWPFLLPEDSFDTTGTFRCFRPNVKWSAALEDLRTMDAPRVWEPDVQRWVDLSYYNFAEAVCGATTGSGGECSRAVVAGARCWQHPDRAATAA